MAEDEKEMEIASEIKCHKVLPNTLLRGVRKPKNHDTTADSSFRVNERRKIENRLRIPEMKQGGQDPVKFVNRYGTGKRDRKVIAKDCNRIVYGDHGPTKQCRC